MGIEPGQAESLPSIKLPEEPGRAVSGPEWRDQPRAGFQWVGRVLVEARLSADASAS